MILIHLFLMLVIGRVHAGIDSISIAFVTTTYPTGTAVLRGEHFADILHNTTYSGVTLNAWLVRSQDMWGSEFLHKEIDVCVIIKMIERDVMKWCRSKKAFIVYDALDNQKFLNFVAGTRRVLPPHVPSVGMILTANTFMKDKLKYATGMDTEVLYHQHTNPGVVRPLECIQRNVGAVGLLVGSDMNLPSEETLGTIRNHLCNELGDTCSVEVLCLSQQLRSENEAKISTRRFQCRRRSDSKVNIQTSYCEQSNQWNTINSLRAIDRTNQLQFHIGKGLDTVDIAIVWPASYDNSSFHRPSTRLLYWMSHGVPCVFYPNYAYIEIARTLGYVFPRRSNFDGLVPAASTTQMLSRMIAELIRSADMRLHFRRKGIEIAAKYTTELIARDLRQIIVAKAKSSIK